MLWDRLGTHSITLVCYHGLSMDDPEFYTTLWGEILGLGSTHVIWCGDLNTALNPINDRSNPLPYHYTKTLSILLDMFSDNGLLDARRHLHPAKREGTHYTALHSTWARLLGSDQGCCTVDS